MSSIYNIHRSQIELFNFFYQKKEKSTAAVSVDKTYLEAVSGLSDRIFQLVKNPKGKESQLAEIAKKFTVCVEELPSSEELKKLKEGIETIRQKKLEPEDGTQFLQLYLLLQFAAVKTPSLDFSDKELKLIDDAVEEIANELETIDEEKARLPAFQK